MGTIILILNTLAASHLAQSPQCEANELVGGEEEYNELVCRGLTLVGQKRYSDAVVVFESALRRDLVELPNFKLLPRLAHAYYLAGDLEKARSYLNRGRLSLLVWIGAIKCEQSLGQLRLAPAAIQLEFRADDLRFVTQKMCGDALEPLYNQRTFAGIVADAELIRAYQHVAAIVGEGDRQAGARASQP